MTNILIGLSELEASAKFLNTLTKINPDVKVGVIAKNGMEVVDLLNNYKNIDAFIIDYDLKVYNGSGIIKNIQNKKKYEKACILLTDNEKQIREDEKIMNKNIIYEILPKETKIEEIINVLNKMLATTELHSKNAIKIRRKITREVVGLGYDMSYKGTQYVITAVELLLNNPEKKKDILGREMYPLIARYYNNTAHNVKCDMNRATTIMYNNCEVKKYQDYFNLDPIIKPRVKTIVGIIANKIE